MTGTTRRTILLNGASFIVYLWGASEADALLRMEDVPVAIKLTFEARGIRGPLLIEAYEAVCADLGRRLVAITGMELSPWLSAYIANWFIIRLSFAQEYVIDIIGKIPDLNFNAVRAFIATPGTQFLAQRLASTKIVRALMRMMEAIPKTLSQAEQVTQGSSRLVSVGRAFSAILNFYLVGKATQAAIDLMYDEWAAEYASIGQAAEQENYNRLVEVMMERVKSGQYKLRAGATLAQAVKMLAANLKANRAPFSGMVHLSSNGPGVNTGAVFELGESAGQWVSDGIDHIAALGKVTTWRCDFDGKWSNWTLTLVSPGQYQAAEDRLGKATGRAHYDVATQTLTLWAISRDGRYAATYEWKVKKVEGVVITFEKGTIRFTVQGGAVPPNPVEYSATLVRAPA
jgi:hypothetical protein